MRCRWCYGDCGNAAAKPDLGTAEWLEFIDYLVANDFIQVYFEGGEPFCREDFLQILEYCTPKMMTFVRTHGTHITPELAARLKAIGVGRVLVDILGANAQTHDALTGSAGSFEKSCAGVRNLARAGVKTDVLVIMNRENHRELQALVDLSHSLGALRLGVLRLYPLGRAKRAWNELSLSLDEQMAALANLRSPPGFKVMQSWHPNDRNCCWQAAAVTASGDSVGCMYLREYVNYGNVRAIPLLEGWRTNPLYRSLREGEVKKTCTSCHEKEGTHGGCRSTAFAFHGRWDAPDPFCSHLNDGVDLRVLPQRLLSQDA